jgi:hypothetical protein
VQEPLQQTVRQVHCAFEALLDILEAQRDHAAVLGLPQAEAAAICAYLEAAALDIMGIGGFCRRPSRACLGLGLFFLAHRDSDLSEPVRDSSASIMLLV